MKQNAAKSNVLPLFPQHEPPSDVIGSPKLKYLSDIISLTATDLNKKYCKTYNSWRNMKSRATQGLCIVHPDFNGFKDFLRIAGPNPADIGSEHSYTLDRINPFDKEYAPGKVKWSTKQEQGNNKTNVTLYTFNGKTLNLNQWAEITGRSRQTLQKRLDKGLPYSQVFCYDTPKSIEIKSFEQWQQLPMDKRSDVEKLEKLFNADNHPTDSGGMYWEKRGHWLLCHFLKFRDVLTEKLGEAIDPFTGEFPDFKDEKLNPYYYKVYAYYQKVEEVIKKLANLYSGVVFQNIGHRAHSGKFSNYAAVFNAYFFGKPSP